jgi:hypothetical protein
VPLRNTWCIVDDQHYADRVVRNGCLDSRGGADPACGRRRQNAAELFVESWLEDPRRPAAGALDGSSRWSAPRSSSLFANCLVRSR